MQRMNGWIDANALSEFDVQGFVSTGGHALGECLDAAGIDLRVPEERAIPG
jgi:hypothetical protein